MKNIICDLQKISGFLEKAKIPYVSSGKIQLDREFFVDSEHRFYFSESGSCSGQQFDVIQLSHEDFWNLDKFQNCLYFQKECLKTDDDEYYIYTRRGNTTSCHLLEPASRIAGYYSDELQLKMCDIYLLIPGKIDKKTNAFASAAKSDHALFKTFKDKIEHSINVEYSSDFFKKMERTCLGATSIRIKTIDDGPIFNQTGLLGIVEHPSGFCILEIMVPCCAIGGNKLLNYYCEESIEFQYDNAYYTINALLKKLGIRRFGKKRSLVFAYGKPSEEEIINALANEEFPMGKINGAFFKTLASRDIAHYNTAQVYVSSETIIEVCNTINLFPDDRIAYHVIEIFFVEMVLFQDAAIDKIHVDLQKIIANDDVSTAVKRSEEINYEMTQVLRFSDYNHFLFPTVRESAKVIATAFGIEHTYEKYERDKYLVDSIIKSNIRKTQEKQDAVKNRFLFLISTLSTIGILGEIIHVFFDNARVSAYSYILALIIFLVFYGIYRLTLFFAKKRKN